MKKLSSFKEKYIDKKITILLLVPVMVFAMLVAPVGLLGSVGTKSASAADPRGDWATQYWATYRFARDHECRGCKAIEYHSSDSYGANSRWFKWNLRYTSSSLYDEICTLTVYIGNNYYIFNWAYWNNCYITTRLDYN